MKKTVKKGTVFEKEVTKIFINGENTMTMPDIKRFKGHTGSAIHGIFVAAGRAETAMTAERNKFKFPAVRTAIHGTTVRRITTMNHLVNIFNDSRTRMEFVNDVFIIISKDGL